MVLVCLAHTRHSLLISVRGVFYMLHLNIALSVDRFMSASHYQSFKVLKHPRF